LRELRRALGLSQQDVAMRAGISLSYYGALERGDKRINTDTEQRLRTALHYTPGELFAGGAMSPAVPLRYVIAAAESETRPASFELPEPHERLQPLRFAQAGECFAVEIVDDSADLDFAQGTVLFVRAAPLHVGARIVVRFLITDRDPDGARTTYEILYGILDQNVIGDLVLVTRTRNRLVPRHALIQEASPLGGGLAERPLVMQRRSGAIDYEPRPTDPAEILGVVVYAAGPP
jgi:transcriptional regulator with XRE-family HTH domain